MGHIGDDRSISETDQEEPKDSGFRAVCQQ